MRTTLKKCPAGARQPAATRPSTTIRESETRLRMALEAADMVSWEWDIRSGRVRYSSNMQRFARGKAIAVYCSVKTLFATLHPRDREGLRKALDLTIREGLPFECEYRTRLLDGKYHWILGKGRRIIRELGAPVRVLGVSLDITARKRIEQDLQIRSRQLAELASKLILVEHRERRHLAEMLHENLQQILVGARLQVHALESDLQAKPHKDLVHVGASLEEALSVSSSMTRLLAPPLSLQADFPPALRWLVQEMRSRHQLDVILDVPANIQPFPEAVHVLLFSAARELLLNVVKHADVRQAGIRLAVDRGCVTLEVHDRGKGFNIKKAQLSRAGQGFGLFSIQERTDLLGGTVVLRASPGRGTRILLSLPIPKAATSATRARPP